VKESKALYTYLDNLRVIDLKNLSNYFNRFGYLPSVRNKKVMDFGCGQGLLCLKLLSDGASEVLGIDNDEIIINFAREKIPNELKALQISFTSDPIDSLKSDYFDLIFTKDAFEHCDDFEDVFFHLNRILKPGGSLVVGFGPLWNSPFGDHKILQAAIGFTLPWLHLLFSDEILKGLFNNSSMDSKTRIMKDKIECIDSYLNKITLERFFKVVEDNSFEITYKNVNAHQNKWLDLIGKFKAFSFLGKYWDRNVYCILKKN
jgi:SAM-dependent methyltransferase